MTVKEKIIRKSIKAIEVELKKVNYIMKANPIIDIINLEAETIETAKKMPPFKAIKYLKERIKKRNELLALAKKQTNSVKLIEKKVKLGRELNDLQNELYLIVVRAGG